VAQYVAFLRAINVGGRTVKMTKLSEIFESLGFSDVETFIASGNVIFKSRSGNTASLEKKVEQALEKSLGFEVATMIRSTADLTRIVGIDAFPGSVTPTSTMYVGLLKSAPDEATRVKFAALGTATDAFRVEGCELYWLSRSNLMQSSASGAILEKTVGTRATFRNVSTLRKLAAKYCQ
jgi:uncharacterized protein (DUF1697 family)